MTADERAIKFLEGLTKLTKKYQIAIGGCGCCDSPYLDNIKEGKLEYVSDEYFCVSWSREKQKYQTKGDIGDWKEKSRAELREELRK